MKTVKRYVLPYLWITAASAVYALGFNWCYEPNQIGFGGITGVARSSTICCPGRPSAPW